MIRRSPLVLFVVLGVALFGGLKGLTAQSTTNASWARLLQKQLSELHDLRRQRQLAIAEIKARDHELEDQIARLEQQAQALEANVAELKDEHGDLEAEIHDADTHVYGFGDWQNHLCKFVLPVAERLVLAIQRGVHYQRSERLKRARGLVTKLRAKDRAGRCEALREFFELCGEELQASRSFDFWNEPVELPDGRRVQAYQLRVGLLNQAFLSEDGQVFGVAARDSSRDWFLDLNKAEQQALLRTLESLQGRRSPELLPLPFANPRATEGSK